jgi:hypothetical protein
MLMLPHQDFDLVISFLPLPESLSFILNRIGAGLRSLLTPLVSLLGTYSFWGGFLMALSVKLKAWNPSFGIAVLPLLPLEFVGTNLLLLLLTSRLGLARTRPLFLLTFAAELPNENPALLLELDLIEFLFSFKKFPKK